jgi:hypothetical protein
MHVSTRSGMTASVCKKALFSLLRNYGYDGWNLGLRHIMPTLLNLGMEETAILDQTHYDNILTYRLQTNNIKFNIRQFLPTFFNERFNDEKTRVETEAEDSDDDYTTKELLNGIGISVGHIKISYMDSEEELEVECPYLSNFFFIQKIQ